MQSAQFSWDDDWTSYVRYQLFLMLKFITQLDVFLLKTINGLCKAYAIKPGIFYVQMYMTITHY